MCHLPPTLTLASSASSLLPTTSAASCNSPGAWTEDNQETVHFFDRLTGALGRVKVYPCIVVSSARTSHYVTMPVPPFLAHHERSSVKVQHCTLLWAQSPGTRRRDRTQGYRALAELAAGYRTMLAKDAVMSLNNFETLYDSVARNASAPVRILTCLALSSHSLAQHHERMLPNAHRRVPVPRVWP